jgi:hypothetical protein
MSLIALLESISGTSLPPHLYFIEQLIAISFAFVLILSVLHLFTGLFSRR